MESKNSAAEPDPPTPEQAPGSYDIPVDPQDDVACEDCQ